MFRAGAAAGGGRNFHAPVRRLRPGGRVIALVRVYIVSTWCLHGVYMLSIVC